jgi:hypothetical protein
MGSTWRTVGSVVTVLRWQPNLVLLLRCSMTLGIPPVALQAIASAFPALVNPAVGALAIAKRWWLTLQHRCAPFHVEHLFTREQMFHRFANKKLLCARFPDFNLPLVAVTMHSGSQTFIRSPLSCCAGVADFAGLCRILPREVLDFLCFQSQWPDS